MMTIPACWPDWLDKVWAKSAEKGADGQPESLAQHTWAVLDRLADFIRLRPDLPQTLGVPRLWHMLFWAAFIHDFGKAASGFQARLRGGERWPHRHEVLSLAFMDWIAPAFTVDEQTWVAAAIVSHHKCAEEIASLYRIPDDLDDDPLVARVAELDPLIIQGLWRWLTECAEAWIIALGLQDYGIALPAWHDFSSVTPTATTKRIYDWLDSYRRFVKALNTSRENSLVIGTLTLRGLMINSDQSASAHAGDLPRVVFDGEQILQSRTIATNSLFNHQSQAWQAAGSALLTAPTGSGKTEAALLWVARQAAEGDVPRLFYTLPYQASMNAMERRLKESFGDKMVGLQHGRSLLALYRQLLDDKEYTRQHAASEAKWARNLAKLNYPPVRVFSPYQMLKGMYRLKGYEPLLTDYHDATFIFDEIHAYETTRLAMILSTISYLAQHYRARFLIMSATFPSLLKRHLQEALGDVVEIQADQEVFTKFQRHRLHLLDGEVTDKKHLEHIADEARQNKSVLVVCNLVDRAQAVYDTLSSMLNKEGIAVELLHGRFNVHDRLAKEKLIQEATGAKSTLRRPLVLVATQAVEVSLDIDLDTIYSDPAPLEALVQRFGRVNRARKQEGLAPVYVFRAPTDGQKIYEADLVQATLHILEREKDQPIDESAIGRWLDEIYVGEIAERWERHFKEATENFEASCVRSLRAFQSDRSLQEFFYQAFESVEVLPNDLYNEFEQLKKDEPIRAYELLVPISLRRYHALKGKGRIHAGSREMPPVVEAPYNAELGLHFEQVDEGD